MKPIISTVLAIAVTATVVDAALAAPILYIPLGDANQVQVIDAATHQIVDTIDGVGNAHGLAITPDKRFLIAGSFSETSVGDIATPSKPASRSEAEHEKHHNLTAVSPSNEFGTSYVSIIDADSRLVVRKVAVRGSVHHVAVSPTGKFAITTHPSTGSISVIDLETFDVVASVKTGPAPNYAVFSDDGRTVYVSNTGDNSISEIDVPGWTEARHLTTGTAPEHIVVSADGLTLYINNVGDGTVSAISLFDGNVSRSFPVGAAPHGIDVSDDGATLFATSKTDNKLVAIDLASGNSQQIPLSPAPYHLTAVHGSGTLYVSSRAENRIWIIDQSTLKVLGEIAIDGIGHQMVMASRWTEQ